MKSFLFLLVISSLAFGKTFRIAALYPTTTVSHINCSCGFEAACITKAAVAEAKNAGLDVSLEVYQTDRSVFGAVDAANRVATERFDAVVGTLISPEALPVSEVLERAQIPFITPTATHPQVTSGKKFVLRIPFNDYRQSMLLARLAVTELKSKQIAVVRNTSTPYSDFLGNQFSKEALKLNSNISVTDHPIFEDFNDWKGLAQEILKSNPDLVFVPLGQGLLASLYAALAASNQRLVLLGSDTIEGKPQFTELFGTKKTNIRYIFPKHWNDKLTGAISQRYLRVQKKYCSQYTPSMASAAAYDAIELLLNAHRNHPESRGETLIKSIRSEKFEGMTGPMNYGADGDPVKPIELFELVHGEARHWKRYE